MKNYTFHTSNHTFHTYYFLKYFMFYLINKPLKMSSFQVIRELRKKLEIKKMGHIWTLDPLATWLMLIATENSTKLLSFLNNDKKSYIFTVKLDGRTESLDLEQPVENIDISKLSIPDNITLENLLKNTTSQVPPKFSAIHINWKRAYKLARKDRSFDIPERKITVHDAKILSKTDTSIQVEITISSGGYIRSFAPQIGKYCSIDGGYISELHRHELFFQNFVLTEHNAQNLENFDKNHFISEEMLFPNFFFFECIDEKIFEDISHGREIILPWIFPEENQYIFVYFWKKASLLQYKNKKYTIVKNNLTYSSHKNHNNSLDFF